MKKFTVKDFIAYSSPCFSCHNKTSFSFGIEDNFGESYCIRAQVFSKYVSHVNIDLNIKYKDTLNLKVYCATNQIFISNRESLTKFLEDHKMYLSTSCNKCGTLLESKYLNFDLSKNRIAATSMFQELIKITDKDYRYVIKSNFDKETTDIIVHKIFHVGIDPIPPLEFTLPLLPIFKIKNKQNLLNKLRTYILFS